MNRCFMWSDRCDVSWDCLIQSFNSTRELLNRVVFIFYLFLLLFNGVNLHLYLIVQLINSQLMCFNLLTMLINHSLLSTNHRSYFSLSTTQLFHESIIVLRFLLYLCLLIERQCLQWINECCHFLSILLRLSYMHGIIIFDFFKLFFKQVSAWIQLTQWFL